LPSLLFMEIDLRDLRVYDLNVMTRKYRLVITGIGILLGSALCFAQATGDKQREIDLHTRKAQALLLEKKPDLAIPELQALVKLDPANADAQANLGVLLFFRQDYKNALPHLQDALKLHPGLWKIQALLGMCERRTGEDEAGRTDLEAAFPQLSETKIRTEVGLELIESYTATGDLDKAATTVSVLRALDPANASILYAAYRIYSDQAGEAGLSLAITDPESAQVHQMMAHELARQGDTQAAIANFREALKIDPKLPGLHFELAEILNSLDTEAGHKEAEIEYKAALAANPFDGKSECKLGELADKHGDEKLAIAHYSHALELRPDDTDAMLGLARIYVANQQSDKALPLLEHAVQLDPTSAVAHFRLGTLYRHAGRTADAEREIEQYKKYKEMKEKLREAYKKMRLPANAKDAVPDAEK